MLRITTSGVLKSYRLNLTQSYSNLTDAQHTVLTGRDFNSYAEDPATASEAFTLRRSFLRNQSQQDNCQALISQYDVAWSTLESVISDISNEKSTSAFSSVMQGLSGPTGSGRKALGNSLLQTAKSLMQSMNVKYGDNYVFAGANGSEVPFTMDEDGTLRYQGVAVDDPANQAELEALAGESRYVDIGLGLQSRADGTVIESTAFNTAMCGIDYLGYGVDDQGLPNNIISAIHEMGTILARCDENGSYSSDPQHAGDQERLTALFGKLSDLSSTLSSKHVEMDTQASFLQENLTQLQNAAYTLNEQIVGLEEVDLAEAITDYSWAQYCYNAALKVGNSILSETLIDFMT